MGHVVNNAMAVKAHALWWRLSGAERDRVAVYDMIAKLDRYHGMVTGVFTGDECLAGLSPIQGTELCAVVEYMYSLECCWLSCWAIRPSATGWKRSSSTRCRRPSRPICGRTSTTSRSTRSSAASAPDRPGTPTGPESNIFGVEPNYGCCTANLSQGWPKFAAHLWMRRSGRSGLAAVAYAPSQVETTDRGGAAGQRALETDYPFRETLRFSVRRLPRRCASRCCCASRPGRGRGGARGGKEATSASEPGAFPPLEREWEGTTEVVLRCRCAPPW
jgi:uncharacterized protein